MHGYVNTCFQEDCVLGCQKHIPDNAVDLIVTDPPYGIGGDTLHKHYNRKEEYVLDGYTEVAQADYPQFTQAWIKQAERVLRPGGSLYVVSGHTNLRTILNALEETTLEERNHIIWKYSFGVYTRNKFVTSHYHILFYLKPGGRPTFNTFCRFGPEERNGDGGSENYLDREDVWSIPREYKPGTVKNKNELPYALLQKIMQYSSNEGDLVCDFFLGGFSTAIVAKGLNRNYCGFEINENAFMHNRPRLERMVDGSLLDEMELPKASSPENQGKHWTAEDLTTLQHRYDSLRAGNATKGEAIRQLCGELGRGRFALMNALKRIGR